MYAGGVWGTDRQWQALGAQVRKGEHASLGVLWKELRAKGDEGSDDEDGDHRRLFAKAFSLFNADQVDGYAPEPGPVLPDSELLAAAEAFIAALGIDTVYGSASAYYTSPKTASTCRISAPSTTPTASMQPIFMRPPMPAGAPIGSTGISAPGGLSTRSRWRKRPPS